MVFYVLVVRFRVLLSGSGELLGTALTLLIRGGRLMLSRRVLKKLVRFGR